MKKLSLKRKGRYNQMLKEYIKRLYEGMKTMYREHKGEIKVNCQFLHYI